MRGEKLYLLLTSEHKCNVGTQLKLFYFLFFIFYFFYYSISNKNNTIYITVIFCTADCVSLSLTNQT